MAQPVTQEEGEGAPELYHEKQRWMYCGIHAVNNLFQRKAFEKEDFDKVAGTLSPGAFISPHKSMWGLGNYDVNVLTMILQEKGYELRWFDKRKRPENINFDKLFGIIVNTRTSRILFNSFHWIALKKINNKWMNLDSKKKSPEEFKDGENGLITYLESIIENNNQILLVVKGEDTDCVYRKAEKEKVKEDSKTGEEGKGDNVKKLAKDKK